MSRSKIGICYHNRLPAAQELAQSLSVILTRLSFKVWLCPAWDDELMRAELDSTEMLVSLGGDGTLLWAARCALAPGVPVLGVSMGSLAFLSELPATEAQERIPGLLADGNLRIEERPAIQAVVISAGARSSPMPAVNDVVVERSGVGHPISFHVSVDGNEIAAIRGDGVIVATSTGSTGYSLSVGGPVLYSKCDDLIVSFVAPHMVNARALVLPSSALVDIRLGEGQQASLSLDGQMSKAITTGDCVRVTQSPFKARLVRLGSAAQANQRLGKRLGWM